MKLREVFVLAESEDEWERDLSHGEHIGFRELKRRDPGAATKLERLVELYEGAVTLENLMIEIWPNTGFMICFSNDEMAGINGWWFLYDPRLSDWHDMSEVNVRSLKGFRAELDAGRIPAEVPTDLKR